MNKKSINLGPFGVYLWGGLLAIGGAAWGAGAALTANPATGTIYLEQLAKGTAREGYVPVVGYCTSTATGTGTSAGTSDRLCFKPAPAGATLPAGSDGQMLGVKAATATRTVMVTGTQTSTATETYSYTVSQTGTTTGTVTATGATGTFTQTATGTSTGMSTSGSVSVQTQPRGVAIYGSTLYVSANGAAKFQTVNVSNPASMSVLNTYDTCTNPRAVAAWYSGVLVGCGNNHAELWSCTNPSSCTRTYDLTVDDATISVSTYSGSNYALIANSTDNNVQVLDLFNGNVSGTTSAITGCSPWGITSISSTKGAVSCSSNGRVYVVDYSTPASPAVQGYNSFTTPYGLYSWGGRYVASADFGTDSVHIVDSNDPNSPSNIGNVSVGSGCGPFAITGQGAYLFVTCDTAGTMVAIDVSTPSSPTVLGSALSVGTNPRAIAVSGNWAFLAINGSDLVKSVDISRFLTLTGTQTTTNTMTITTTVTTTTTTTATGTQTVATTGIVTSSTTGTATATGSDSWAAVNGTLYAGTNIRFTKGTGTDTDTSAAMQDEPKIHLAGFSGTTGVIPKKTAEGWDNSCVAEGTSSVDSSKTIRATSGSPPSTGAGVELLYSSGSEIGYLISIDRGAATLKPLNLSGSSLRFVVNNTVTMLAPTAAGNVGDHLVKGADNSSVWAPTIAPAPVAFSCSTSTTDVTINVAFTLGYNYGLVLEVGPITPKAETTALRFKLSYQGKGTGTTLVANLQALTGPTGSPTNVMWVPKASMYDTVATGSYKSGFMEAVAWDSHWSSATTYWMMMTGVALEFATPGAAKACLEIEELQ